MGLLSALGRRGMRQLRSGAMFGEHDGGGMLSRALRNGPDAGKSSAGGGTSAARTGRPVGNMDTYAGAQFVLRTHPNAPGEGILRLTTNPNATGLDSYPAQIGAIYFVREPNGYRIVQSTVKPEHRGQGNGLALYEELVSRAEAEGLPVLPDAAGVSPDAMRVYAALERRGYQVTRDSNGIPVALRPPPNRYDGGALF